MVADAAVRDAAVLRGLDPDEVDKAVARARSIVGIGRTVRERVSDATQYGTCPAFMGGVPGRYSYVMYDASYVRILVLYRTRAAR